MKALVTILQCRRVVLPYLFVKHVVPRMRARFPGTLDVLIVQHRAKTQRLNPRLRTHRLPESRQDLVERWTAAGCYGDAAILRHDEWHEPYPSIPSWRRAAEAALEAKVDFHLWLEDDALVYDRSCERWEELMGEAEVGVYRPRTHIVNASWFLSRPSFDARILPRLCRYWTWQRFNRIEPWFRKVARGPLAVFDESYAVKNHHREYPYTGMKYLVEAVRDLCAEELGLLELDFGDEARQAVLARAS